MYTNYITYRYKVNASDDYSEITTDALLSKALWVIGVIPEANINLVAEWFRIN